MAMIVALVVEERLVVTVVIVKVATGVGTLVRERKVMRQEALLRLSAANAEALDVVAGLLQVKLGNKSAHFPRQLRRIV